MAHDVTNFDEDVLNASFQKPVVADFWASWCGPCRTLGPILEKLASEQSERWTLAKVDTETFPDLSARFQIRGIPAVKLFVNAEVVDEFTGALPEADIRRWLDAAIPSPHKKKVELIAEMIDAGAADQARVLLEDILVDSPTEPVANAMLARIVSFSDPDRAVALVAIAVASDPAYVALADALNTLAIYRTWLPDQDMNNEDGTDYFLRAISALKNNDPEEVIKSVLEVIKVNRFLQDDASRQIGVAIFITLGDLHPLSQKYRRTFDMWLT